MFENPRRSRQARNFTTNVPKILDLKSSSEQIFFQKLSLGAPESSVSRERDHGQKELAKVQVVWGFGRAGRRARAAGRYGIIWLSRNLRSKLFKLFCCTYLVKRVIELTSEI